MSRARCYTGGEESCKGPRTTPGAGRQQGSTETPFWGASRPSRPRVLWGECRSPGSCRVLCGAVGTCPQWRSAQGERSHGLHARAVVAPRTYPQQIGPRGHPRPGGGPAVPDQRLNPRRQLPRPQDGDLPTGKVADRHRHRCRRGEVDGDLRAGSRRCRGGGDKRRRRSAGGEVPDLVRRHRQPQLGPGAGRDLHLVALAWPPIHSGGVGQLGA